jgi:hypothetical protein
VCDRRRRHDFLPVLADLAIAPSTVDTSSSAQDVTFTLHITDNLSGFQFGGIALTSPDGTQNTATAPLVQTAGDTLDGTYAATATIPAYAQPGAWRIDRLFVLDNATNELNLDATQIQALGFPATIDVGTFEPGSITQAGSAIGVTAATLHGR